MPAINCRFKNKTIQISIIWESFLTKDGKCDNRIQRDIRIANDVIKNKMQIFKKEVFDGNNKKLS